MFNGKALVFSTALVIAVALVGKEKPLRIGYWSTRNIECGIAMYSKHQVAALRVRGHIAVIYSHELRGDELIKRIIEDRIEVLNTQYEPKIMPELAELKETLSKIKQLGVRIIVTVHEETPALQELIHYCDKAIYHKKPVFLDTTHEKIAIIPMGVPAFRADLNKSELRAKYGFFDRDIIITTTGFMSPNKRHADLLELMIPFLKENPHHQLQMLTSFTPRMPEGCSFVNARIKTIIAHHKVADQVHHLTSFLPQKVLVERLSISDIGFLWVDDDTTSILSTSASAKEYIAARLPAIIAPSAHFHDMQEGFIRVPGPLDNFATEVIAYSKKKGLLEKLRDELDQAYKRLHYTALIEQYLQVLRPPKLTDTLRLAAP